MPPHPWNGREIPRKGKDAGAGTRGAENRPAARLNTAPRDGPRCPRELKLRRLRFARPVPARRGAQGGTFRLDMGIGMG